jgi:hypothetical protein
MKTLRTPEERLTGLPDFPYMPQYVEVDSGDGGRLRVATLVPTRVDDPAADANRAGGGHFLQEDVGPQLARVVADLVAATPRD